MSEKDKFLIIGSDGVFEFIANNDIINYTLQSYYRNNASAACDKIVTEAKKSWKRALKYI